MLINRLQEKIGHHVSVIALFDSPTIAGLAHYLGEACPDVVRRVFGPESLSAEHARDADSRSDGAGTRHRPKPRELLVALQPEGSGTPWFMVHPPGGIVVCYQALSQRLGRERPFYGIRSRGLHGEPDLPGRLEEMAEEYVAAIREVQPRGPYLLGGWSAGGLVALEMAQQLLAQGESIRMLALLDTIPETADDPNWADKPGMEYGLDLSLEELSRLGPDRAAPLPLAARLEAGTDRIQRPHAGRPPGPRRPQADLPPSHGADRPLCRPSLPRPDHPDPAVRCAVRGPDSRTTGAGEAWRPTSTSISSPASTTAWSRNRTSRTSPGRSKPACGRSKSRSSLKAKWPCVTPGGRGWPGEKSVLTR